MNILQNLSHMMLDMLYTALNTIQAHQIITEHLITAYLLWSEDLCQAYFHPLGQVVA